MEAQANSMFKYQSLEAPRNLHPIRLITLLPAANVNDDLQCELTRAILGQHPDFEALSYTWGDPQDVVPILLHSNTHHITRNLAIALRHLRYPNKPRTLWVDALCINQGDIAERDTCVPRIREIYDAGGAKKVIAWLGEAGDARLALDFCRRAREDPSLATLSGYETEWEACEELFNQRPWWRRAWIIQEVVHTNEVLVCVGDLEPMTIEEMCDYFEEFSYLLDVRQRLQRLSSPVDPTSLQLHRDWNAWIRCGSRIGHTAFEVKHLRSEAKNAQSRPLLPGLTWGFRRLGATDFRDKIYAFLGLAFRGPIWSDIPVDYTLTKSRLFTITSRAFMRNALTPLLVVESYDRPVTRDQELPSWAIDFTTQQTYVSESYLSTTTSFSADAHFSHIDLEPRFAFPLDHKILVLRGVYVAVITKVVESRITQDEDLVGMDQVKLMQYDQDHNSRRQRPLHFPPWHTQVPLTDAPTISHTNTSWAPIFSEPGDIIIVAVGSFVPLVLREFEQDRYLFLGPCWLIDGEIQNVTKLKGDPGFSSIMFGSACEGNDCVVEEFSIH